MGLLLGVSILTAEMSGRGERYNTGRIFRKGLVISLVFGGFATLLVWFLAKPLFVLLQFEEELLDGTVSVTRLLAIGLIAHMVTNTAGSYLEALRRPTIVTVAMYFGVAINLIIDLAFVAGAFGLPKMGADGVAIATSGTRWLLVIVLLAFVAWFTPGFKASEPGEKGEGRKMLGLGYGMAASNVAEWGSFNMTFVVATKVSTFASTVYGMVIHTVGFFFMGFLGIGTATSVRVAEAIGKGNALAARSAGRTGIIAALVFGLMGTLIMLLWSDQVARIFVQKNEMLKGQVLFPVLSAMIAFASVIVIFDGLQNVASMASRALGSVWLPSFIHIGCYVGVMLPLTWLFGIKMEHGLRGVLEGVIFASVLAGTIQFIFLEYLCFRKKSEESGH